MRLNELLTLNDAFAGSRILQAGVRLGIFDVLATRDMTASQLAATLDLDSRATWILCNALVALGLLELGTIGGDVGQIYRNSPAASKWLCKTSGTDFSGKVRFDALLWDIWGKLEESVRSGRAARTPDMFQNDPVETEQFILAMHALVKARGDGPVMARHPLVAGARTILDIGTGPGTYPIAFCEANQSLHAVLFDLPNTLVVTRKVVDQSSCRDRLTLVAGDYRYDTLPGGFDVVFLSNIIHGEDETNNVILMKKIKNALNPGGYVVVKDHILDNTGTNPPGGAIFSVQMLLSTTGRDYTGDEVMGWMKEAGFGRSWVENQEPPLTSRLVIGQIP
ncbi:MAG: methyltransferase domain-containing protein [Myxococcales bacterium]|nr:methyltransferase domain-containing protein [Myxococcales bacterium]